MPDAIRELNQRLQDQMNHATSHSEKLAAENSLTLSLLAEFVAQIAEANESLRKIANPLHAVDAESPWVTLSWRGREFVVNRNDVSSVDQYRSNPAESVLVLRTDNPEDGGRYCEMNMLDLCAALKIEIPKMLKEPA